MKRNHRDTGTRRKKYFALAVAVAAILLAFYFVRSHHAPPVKQTQENDPSAVLASVSHLDFRGIEPQVVEKIQSLHERVENDPQSAEAWGKFGMNLYVHDFKDASVRAYQEAEQLDRADFRWPYYLGLVLLETDAKYADSAFERALKLKPNYAPARLRLGEMQLQFGRLDDAQKQFQMALSTEATSHAYLGLARVALARGNLEESRRNLLETIRLNPNHGEAYGLLAEVYRRLNNHEQADEAMRQARRLPKKTPIADEAQADLTKEGVSTYWFELRGRAYLQQGSYGAAISEFQQAVDVSKDPRFVDELGTAYFDSGNYTKASEEYRSAVERKPDSAVFLNHLANALLQNGNQQQSMDAARKAYRLAMASGSTELAREIELKFNLAVNPY